MAFPDPATFFKAFGLMAVIVLFFAGMIGWMIFIFKKFAPDFKYWLKYNVFKAKYNEDDVGKLLQYYDAKMTVSDVKKLLLLNGFNLNKAKEFCFIYKQIIKTKGGIKNE